jgi:MHS family proline/betaine transporter-like MFS transporter
MSENAAQEMQTTPPTPGNKSTERERAAPRARAVVATVIGNTLEWFDFAAYAFFAALIGRHFFPAGNDAVTLLSSFAVFGVGFVARPLGAVFFGRLGDTRGRKLALLISIPLMGVGTLIVGLSPSYASIGLLAPILLVLGRILQGFSAGGELGNAVAFLVEWAPSHRRGLFSSLQQCSVIFGTLLGSGSAALLTSFLTPENLESWGWRVPFLVGGLVIAPLGLFLRRKVEESPVYEDAAPIPPTRSARSASPWRLGAKTIAVTSAWVVSYYVFLIYLPTFLPKHAGVSSSTALWASTAGLAAMMISIPLYGHLSDRIGRKPPLLVAALVCIVAPYPVFVLLVGGAPLWAVYLVSVVAGAVVGVFAGIGPALMSEMFPTRMRTTGVAVSFGLATAILGGFAPFLSTWLIDATGSPVSPTLYVIAAALVSTAAIFTLRETAHQPLRY